MLSARALDVNTRVDWLRTVEPPTHPECKNASHVPPYQPDAKKGHAVFSSDQNLQVQRNKSFTRTLTYGNNQTVHRFSCQSYASCANATNSYRKEKKLKWWPPGGREQPPPHPTPVLKMAALLRTSWLAHEWKL